MVDVFTHQLLIVQTDRRSAGITADLAASLGFDVDVAHDPETVERLTRVPYDSVWLDLDPGPLDGVRVLRLLRERQPGTSVILEAEADPTLLGAARRIAERSGLRVAGSALRPVAEADRRRFLEVSRAAVVKDDTGAIRRLGDVALSAVADGRIRLVYQPQVSLQTGEVEGAEALARLDVPGFESVSPGAWIPHIEAAGKSSLLLDAVARRAAEDRRRSPALGTLGSVSINVSVDDLVDLTLPERLLGILTAAVPAHRWTLEITETSELETSGAAAAGPDRLVDALDVLTRLRLLGFRLAMDDFGTGTSTFERLHEFPFHELKVNRAFTAPEYADRPAPVTRTAAMLRAAAEIGSALDLTVVVEGVESEAELGLVRAAGCHSVQGYLVSRPVAAHEFGRVCLAWADRPRHLTGVRATTRSGG